jgi:hypothetical protein
MTEVMISAIVSSQIQLARIFRNLIGAGNDIRAPFYCVAFQTRDSFASPCLVPL